MPTRRYEVAQKKPPVKLACIIFLSELFLIPLKMGKKFDWKEMEKTILGTAAAAPYQSSGNFLISPTGGFPKV